MHFTHNIYLEASFAGCVYRCMTRFPHARPFCLELIYWKHVSKLTFSYSIYTIFYSLCGNYVFNKSTQNILSAY